MLPCVVGLNAPSMLLPHLIEKETGFKELSLDLSQATSEWLLQDLNLHLFLPDSLIILLPVDIIGSVWGCCWPPKTISPGGELSPKEKDASLWASPVAPLVKNLPAV